MTGKGEQFHRANAALARELKEALSIRNNDFIKGLGRNSAQFGMEPGMRFGVHRRPDRFARYLLHRVYPHFVGEPIYSAVALHHCLVSDRETALSFFREIRQVISHTGDWRSHRH